MDCTAVNSFSEHIAWKRSWKEPFHWEGIIQTKETEEGRGERVTDGRRYSGFHKDRSGREIFL